MMPGQGFVGHGKKGEVDTVSTDTLLLIMLFGGNKVSVELNGTRTSQHPSQHLPSASPIGVHASSSLTKQAVHNDGVVNLVPALFTYILW